MTAGASGMFRPAALLAPVLLGLALACGAPRQEEADLVIRDAKIYTVDPTRSWAEAVSIKDGRILRVGSDAEILRSVSNGTRVLDVRGRLVLPGFIDSHSHITFGSDPDVLQLSDVRSPREIYERVRHAVATQAPNGWIEGEGWNYSVFPGGALPTWRDLEVVSGDRPVFLVSYDVHTGQGSRRASSGRSRPWDSRLRGRRRCGRSCRPGRRGGVTNA